MKLQLEKLDCKYGAPMGRRNILPPVGAHVDFHLTKIECVDGDYDEGGAYWGNSPSCGWIWCAWSLNRARVFVRAKDREEAKRKVAEVWPNSTILD